MDKNKFKILYIAKYKKKTSKTITLKRLKKKKKRHKTLAHKEKR